MVSVSRHLLALLKLFFLLSLLASSFPVFLLQSFIYFHFIQILSLPCAKVCELEQVVQPLRASVSSSVK